MLRAVEQWITQRRIIAGSIVLLAIYGGATIVWVATTHHLIDGFRQPLGGDFIIFYGASGLTLNGQAAQAFDPAVLLAAQRAVIHGVQPGLEWCYPPTFQLIVSPLALLPFVAAYAAFVGVSLALYLGMIRTISSRGAAMLLACAFPGAFVNAWQGQNGFLSAAALGYGLLNLDRRPWMAGVALGLLGACKPQLAVIVPIVLIGTGRWKTIASAVLSGATLTGASFLAFGADPWLAFLRTLPEVSASASAGLLPWSKMASIFVAARWLGCTPALAYGLQALVGGGAALATFLAWRRPGDHGLKVGLAVLATFLISPYSFNYDLVLLAIPIAATIRHGFDHQLPPGAKLGMLLAAFTPTIFLGFAKATHLQLMPVAILVCFVGLFGLIWREADESERRGRQADGRSDGMRLDAAADSAGARGVVV